MMLYKVGEEPAFVDVKVPDDLESIVGTDQYEWMTVRILTFCIIHDAEGREHGKPLNRVMGKTKLYGDFLVSGLTWDDDGNTEVISISDGLASLMRGTIFNKMPSPEEA